MFCSRYNIQYYKSSTDTFHTILDYCDVLENELNVANSYSSQDVPWVRGKNMGFFPRHNKFHSFSFKKLEDNGSFLSDTIAESRLALFTEDLFSDQSKDDVLIVNLGSIPTVPITETVIDTPATPAYFGWYLYSTDFSTDWDIGSLYGTTRTTGTSSNGAKLYFKSPALSSASYYNLSGLSHQTIAEENTIYIPYGNNIIFDEAVGGDMIYDDGDYTFTIPQPCLLQYYRYYNGKPQFLGIPGTAIAEDWVCTWQPILSAWELDNNGYTFYGYDLTNSTTSPVQVAAWVRSPSSETYMVGDINEVQHYIPLSALSNYIDNTFNTDQTTTITLSVENYNNSQEFGIENYNSVFTCDDGTDAVTHQQPVLCQIETTQTVILTNPIIESVENGIDDIFSDRVWKTYNIKYSDFIPNEEFGGFTLTDNLSVTLTDQQDRTLYQQIAR